MRLLQQNLKKMAGQLGYDYQVEQNDAQSFTVRISKKKGEVASIYEQELNKKMILKTII